MKKKQKSKSTSMKAIALIGFIIFMIIVSEKLFGQPEEQNNNMDKATQIDAF